MKASSSISTIQELMEGDQLRDLHEEPSPEVKTYDDKNIERGVNDLLQGQSSCQTDGSAIRDFVLQEKLNRLMKREDFVAVGEKRMDAELSTVSTFRNETGELYAEYIDHHMADLP